MEKLIKNGKSFFYTLLIVSIIGGLSACGTDRRDNTANDNTTVANDAETVEVDENAWMRERDTFVTTNREIGTRIDQEIEKREKQMDKMNAKSRKAMEASISSLRVKRKNLDTKLGEMEQATQEGWTVMKQGVTDASTELEKTFDAFGKEYKSDID